MSEIITHSQTPPGSVGPVPPDGISGAMSSGHLDTPRHLQGVWDQFLQKESPEQCRPDVWTLPDTSRKCGTSYPRRNLRSNVVRMSGHSQTSRECGTSSPRRNLRSNVVRMSGHSQTPPGSVGPVPLEGISGAMSSGCLDTPRHLQEVWDQFPPKESLEQCCLDIWTLPDTSRECGTSSPRRNLQSNVIWTSGHSQTPPGSVGPVHPEGISRAMSSGRLDTPRHLQGVWDQFPWKESPEQCRPDVWTLPDTSRE